MISGCRRLRAGTTSLVFALSPAIMAGQSGPQTLSPQAWTATDSLRFESHLGRPALWIDRGIALLRGASLENGTLELDVAATDETNFLGVVFRAASPKFGNVVFLRPAASGTEEAVQYGPAFNSLGVAWQVYHGDGANAVVDIPRGRWIPLRIELDGPVARVFVDSVTTPTLVVPRVVSSGGTGIGVWTGAFGRGAYFSNIRYRKSPGSPTPAPEPARPPGTIMRWELSDAIGAEDFLPRKLPDLSRLTWQGVETEPEGFVLVNRFREAPAGGVPRDSSGAVLVDSVLTGRVAGSRIVYARTSVTSARHEIRRLHYTYSNGLVIYLNGRPLIFAMNPGGLRSSTLGVMAHHGDAVYLPLEPGNNEIVFAVIQLTGGWAFSGRWDPS